MMGVSLLLFRKSIRTGWKRLALMTGAVAVGTWIILAFTAIFNAMSNYDRYAFINTLQQQMTDDKPVKRVDGVDPVRVNINRDTWRNTDVRVIKMEKTGSRSPDLLGLKVPDPGEYYVSDALAKIIKEHPEDQIGLRYGTKQLSRNLPSSVSSGRDELVVVAGVPAGTIPVDTTDESRGLVYRFADKLPKNMQASVYETLISYIVYMGVIIILLPVIMLISVSAKLGSVQREKRYAALRLVGATNRQVINIIATEALLSAIAGIVIGTLLYVISMPLLQQVTLEETRYWPDMIVVRKMQYVIIAILTTLLVWLANWWGMRKVHTSPLGITRDARSENKPGWWRIIPLLVGVIILIWLQTKGHAKNYDESKTNIIVIMVALVLNMGGLVLAGPWLTYSLAKLGAKLARKPVGMIGMKYVQVHARAISRSVIGVVLALFAGTFFISATSGIDKLNRDNAGGLAMIDSQTALIDLVQMDKKDDEADKLSNLLDHTDYVSNVQKLPVYGIWSVGRCQDMQSHIATVKCNGDSNRYVAVRWIGTSVTDTLIYADSMTKLGDRLKSINDNSEYGLLLHDTAEQLNAGKSLNDIPTNSYNYLIDIDERNIDRLRTLLVTSNITNAHVISNYEAHDSGNEQIKKLAWMAYGGMAATMVVAIVSIVVSTIGGILERKRSLYTMRLSGMQVSELKRMTIIESLLPLVVTSLVAAGLGIFTAMVFVNNNSTSLRVNISPTYLLIIGGSLLLAVVAIWLILPLLAIATNPSNNRTE